MLTMQNTLFLKASSALIAARLTALKKKRTSWMFGSIRVLHTPLFARTEIISSGRLMFILRAQTNIVVGSSHHFSHLLQVATVLLTSRLSLTVGQLTVRAERCQSHSATVSLRKRLSTSTAQTFFVCGLLLPIITQTSASVLKS